MFSMNRCKNCFRGAVLATHFEVLVGAELQYGEPLDDVLLDQGLLVLLAPVGGPLGLLPDDGVIVVSAVWSIATVGLALPLGLHALGASSASVSLLHLHIHDSDIAAVPTVAAAIRRHSDRSLPAAAPPGAMADSAPRPPRLIPSPGRPTAHRTPSPTTHTNNTIHRIEREDRILQNKQYLQRTRHGQSIQCKMSRRTGAPLRTKPQTAKITKLPT
ncbi:hypothetical protein Zmor_023520 [Zophobas morio]|uniref:Uncharacterized protein n=1 Tax=Zophobas morio TaxID=2755281 RepID=A0AA38I3B0_9CUCU|nr:hypothetical protein Zmor_023520 [Zophobas morio]